MPKIKYIDLFAGIGGFHMAFDNVGAECVFASEINEPARQTYYNNFINKSPEMFKKNRFSIDITKTDYSQIPDFDILCGGFPCQPFSICGHKKGFEDTRGTLFFNICEIIQKKSPKVVFLENVKHLIHHDKGRTLSTIILSLEDLGYQVSYKLMNAVDFNVPQNRERLIIIASKNKTFNFNKINHSIRRRNIREFLEESQDSEILDKEEYTILESPKIQPKSGLIFAGYRNKNIWKKGIRPNTKHLSRVHRQPNRIYSVDGTHPTIPSQETAGRFFIYDKKENIVRKLTIRECYKIMGFPDNYIIHPTVGEAYKQIGNSVCVPMMTEIVIEIKKQLMGNNNNEKTFKNSNRSFSQEELFCEFRIKKSGGMG